MTWIFVAYGLALGVDWRRLVVLILAVLAPVPSLALITAFWWRARPALSMRATRFCDAVSGELRAGASLRLALEKAADSVEAPEVARRCRLGAPMGQIAAAARVEFSEIGPEIEALLAGSDGVGVSPAALFDEIGGLALAQVEMAHEVSIASAPARATGAVLLIVPIIALGWALTRGSIETFVRHPAQRAAATIGLSLIGAGIAMTVLILRRAR